MQTYAYILIIHNSIPTIFATFIYFLYRNAELNVSYLHYIDFQLELYCTLPFFFMFIFIFNYLLSATIMAIGMIVFLLSVSSWNYYNEFVFPLKCLVVINTKIQKYPSRCNSILYVLANWTSVCNPVPNISLLPFIKQAQGKRWPYEISWHTTNYLQV